MYNLENQHFGYLVVINRLPGGKWLCRCDCGKEIIVLTHDLLYNIKKSCGCILKNPYHIVTDQKFGSWTVIKQLDGQKFLCRCICGTEKEILARALQQGKTCSCGCQKIGPHVDITGQRYGHLTAVKPAGKSKNRRCVWIFRCDCGKEIEYTKQEVEWQNKISCGCFSKPRNINKNNTSGYNGVHFLKSYKKWSSYITFNGKQYKLGFFEKDVMTNRIDFLIY